MSDVMSHFPWLFGKPSVTGTIKNSPEDFLVDEVSDFEPAGLGEHMLVHIQKRGENTQYVANELAKACGVKSRDVSWAGLKDRHAVTTQWLGVHLPGKENPDLTEFVETHEGVEAVLAVTRHNKKLRPGDLAGNRFTLVLREVSDMVELERRLQLVKEQGVPNYYGEQRFGREGNNVTQARRWGADEIRVRDKNKRSFYLSAARSWLFNQILAARIEAGTAATLLQGDCLLDNEERMTVAETVTPSLLESVSKGTLHITGAVAGDNALPGSGEAEAFEMAILDKEPELMALIRGNRMRQERRELLLKPQDMAWHGEGDVMTVSFSLPAGCFATAVVRELMEYTEGTPEYAHSDK
ncbi:tRNA pseudouridine(13) synthase TruD [Parasalinivibrio latis]|uniref:tRNA pseudouridine(13) synthase TruD n=1 Tax=Parasalinivibrio latis TaxID=2952610 RepID=UPI0030DF64D1